MAALPAPQRDMLITDLSDNHLLKVFSRLPVSFLLNHVEHVCKRFKHITDIVYENTTKIVLIEPKTETNLLSYTLTRSLSVHRHYWLYIDSFKKSKIVDPIAAKFKSIKSLEVRQEKLIFTPVLSWLDQWKDLESLSVIAFSLDKPMMTPWKILLDRISEKVTKKETKLKHLTVLDWGSEADSMITDFPNLEQLETINVGLHVDENSMDKIYQWPLLRSFGLVFNPTGENASTKTLAVIQSEHRGLIDNSGQLAQLNLLNLHFPLSLTMQMDEKFCLPSKFASLTHVQVCSLETVNDFLNHSSLHLLPQLSSLHLNNLGVVKDFSDKICTQGSDQPRIEVRYATLKTLRLAFAVHEQFSWANKLLPALKMIVVDSTSVGMCKRCLARERALRRRPRSERVVCQQAEDEAIESMANLHCKPRVIFGQRTVSPQMYQVFEEYKDMI